jgi:hypothetical protein
MKPLTIESTIHFKRRGRGARKEICHGDSPVSAEMSSGRIPRVSKLMALAIRFEGLIAPGDITDYAELARLGHVTRARITQIMNLRLLAPDLQEQLLFLPRVERGDDPVFLGQLQAIAQVSDWRKQRRLWQELRVRTN